MSRTPVTQLACNLFWLESFCFADRLLLCLNSFMKSGPGVASSKPTVNLQEIRLIVFAENSFVQPPSVINTLWRDNTLTTPMVLIQHPTFCSVILE